MTNYKANHVSLDTEPNLPNELRNFYCRFGTKNSSQPFRINASEPTAPLFLIRGHDVKKTAAKAKQ